MTTPLTAEYYPAIFNAADEAGARQIILTSEGAGADTETRWAQETPYLIDLLRTRFPLPQGALVLDYGCGIGRMSRAMIEAFDVNVIGIDISPNMRSLAAAYVQSDRFLALSPSQFATLQSRGLRADAAICIWVLQHCFAPATDIAAIAEALAPEGRCFVLNMPKRAVPAMVQPADQQARFVWAADMIDVADLLRARFTVLDEGLPDQSTIPNMADAGSYWMVLR